MPAAPLQEIACQQVLVDDASVFSIQWSEFPDGMAAGLTAESLLERYLTYIRRCTAGAIRPWRDASGIEFRLFGSTLSLISFTPPILTRGDCLLNICGGLLVSPRQCDRGQLHFGIEAGQNGTKVILQLSDFCPLLLGSSSPSAFRRVLYRLTQALIHRLVTVRFLVLLYRDLAGRRAAVKIVEASVRDGRRI